MKQTPPSGVKIPRPLSPIILALLNAQSKYIEPEKRMMPPRKNIKIVLINFASTCDAYKPKISSAMA